jgi:hypothetical protein
MINTRPALPSCRLTPDQPHPVAPPAAPHRHHRLHELLITEGADTGEVGQRLQVLHAQDLTGLHHDGWYLTDGGLTTACALPKGLGLRPTGPITNPGSVGTHAADALAMTGLGLPFRRRRHAACPGAPR